MQKKCTLITAAAGLVLALGAPVVGSLPAMAATAPTSSVSAAATTPELGSGGHVFAHGIVTLTSAVYDQGRITVDGVITERVRDVQIARGRHDTRPARSVPADTSRRPSSPIPRVFELRFGTKVNNHYFQTAESVLWSAVAPGTPPETPGPLPTLTPLPVPADPNPAPEPLPEPEHDAKQPGMPNVLP